MSRLTAVPGMILQPLLLVRLIHVPRQQELLVLRLRMIETLAQLLNVLSSNTEMPLQVHPPADLHMHETQSQLLEAKSHRLPRFKPPLFRGRRPARDQWLGTRVIPLTTEADLLRMHLMDQPISQDLDSRSNQFGTIEVIQLRAELLEMVAQIQESHSDLI